MAIITKENAKDFNFREHGMLKKQVGYLVLKDATDFVFGVIDFVIKYAR